jgi:hypothetical protein
VAAEVAIDAKRGKAILFLSGVRPGALALVTVEPELVARLAADAQGLWERSNPYLERRTLAEAAAAAGLVIETQGTVQDVLPYQGHFLLRLEEAGQVLGVQVDQDAEELRGAKVLVRGRVMKDARGYPTLHASDLRRIR